MSGGFPLSSLPGNTTTPTVIMPETGGIRVNNMPSPERAQMSGAVPRCPRKHPNTFNGAGVAIYGVDVNAPVVPMMRAETDRPSNLDNIALDRYSPAPGAHASRTGGLSTLRSNNTGGARYSYRPAYYAANDRFDGKFREIELQGHGLR